MRTKPGQPLPHWYISLGKTKQDSAKPHTGRVKPIVHLHINIHSLLLSVVHATDGHWELLMGQAPMVRFSTEDLVVRACTRTHARARTRTPFAFPELTTMCSAVQRNCCDDKSISDLHCRLWSPHVVKAHLKYGCCN